MGPRRVLINKEGFNESLSFTQLLDTPQINESRNLLKSIFDQLWSDAIDAEEVRTKLDEATFTGNLSRGMLFFFVNKKGANKFFDRAKELIKDAGQDVKNFKMTIEVDDADEQEGVMMTLRTHRAFAKQRDLESKLRDTYLGFMRESKEVTPESKLDEGYSTKHESPTGEPDMIKAEVEFEVHSREVQDDIFDRVSDLLIKSSKGHQVSLEKELKFHNGEFECKLEFEQHGAKDEKEVKIFFDTEEESRSFFTELLSIFEPHIDDIGNQIYFECEVKWIAGEFIYYVEISENTERPVAEEEAETSSPFTSDNE